MNIIDLRSDTVTKPCEGMRQAMANAIVGDDVYGEDPTVSALEEQVAAMLGYSHGLFVPSGTMGNQIALRVHTRAGDEVIIEARGHSYAYETGGMAALAGVQTKALPGERGILSIESIEAAINPDELHHARSSLIILENTANLGGGTVYPLSLLKEIQSLAKEKQLALHIDGARLWNAHIASNTPLSDYGRVCDSISLCLSKGLGAPVGSLLVGDEAFIHQARRYRKMYGGGMRQAGILAAGALYALKHNLPRLCDDHRRLQTLAHALATMPGLRCEPKDFPSNIVFATITDGRSAAEIAERLKATGILVHALSEFQIRFVTHLDLNDEDIEETIHRVGNIFKN